jgi:hypothetical protein
MDIFKTNSDHSGDDFSLLAVLQAHDFYSYLVENYSQKNSQLIGPAKSINASLLNSYNLPIGEHEHQIPLRDNLLDTL